MKNKRIKLIIFDMDGTLADTSLGIINCHKHANVKMGKQEPTTKELEGIIGSPLLDAYKNRFGFSDEDAVKAVSIYRERYKEKGVFEANLYNGMAETLSELKRKGYTLAVATLKADVFAKQMLENMGVSNLFSAIHGVDMKDTLTKSALVKLCLAEFNIAPKNAVLVGDSIHDFNGAKDSSVNFIGATYGFGFKSFDDLKNLNPYGIIEKPLDLLNIFKKDITEM